MDANELSFLKIPVFSYIPRFNNHFLAKVKTMSRHLGVWVASGAFIFLSQLSFAKVQPQPVQQSQSVQQTPASGQTRKIEQSRPVESIPARGELNQQVVDQIKDIRNRVGGSIADQFKGLGLDEPTKQMAEQEFERELIRLATQVKASQQDDPNRPPINPGSGHYLPAPGAPGMEPAPGMRPANPIHLPPFQGSAPQSNHVMQAANSSFSPNFYPNSGPAFPPVKAAAKPGVPPNSPPLKAANNSGFPMVKRSSSDQLRAAARRLEELAAELEVADLYEEADQIRNQAGKFWLKARKTARGHSLRE